jgi:phospholipid/cholesterol/gamma-HCH transport system substrate-binding protein
MTRRRRPLLALLALFALVATGCSRGDGTIEISATFPDSLDLVPRAHVRAGDVPIGIVTRIELTDDLQARVVMRIEDGTGLPTDTEALLAKTSLLGERYVDLRPIGTSGALADGQELTDTRVVTDIEDLVASGNAALAFVAADQLSAAVQVGAEAFGGRGGQLGQFISDVEAFVGRYDDGREDLLRLIDTLDDLTAATAADAEFNAATLETLVQASRALEEEDDRLLDTLEEVERLAVVGERILREHRQEFDDQIRRLRILVQQFSAVDGALADLLTWFPRHNIHVRNGYTDEEAQVWLDFLVCGLTDTPGDPSRACDPPNPGQPGERPDFHPTDEACWDDHANCAGTQRDER